MNRTRYWLTLVFVALLAGTLCASAMGTRAAGVDTGSNKQGQILLINTHGSVWQYRDDLWRYPAFKAFEPTFHIVNRVALDQVLQDFGERTMQPGGSLTLNFQLDQAVGDALVFDLVGSTAGYGGLRCSMTVRGPDGRKYRSHNHMSERSLHIDQPPLGSYRIEFYSDLGGTFRLRVGTGRSPFLEPDVLAYSFLFVPDLDTLTAREKASAKRFVQDGGKLVVVVDAIHTPRYYTFPNIEAVNDLTGEYGILLTSEMLTTTQTITANGQPINVLTHIIAHEVTQGIDQVLSTGPVLALSDGAEALVLDDAGNAAIAVRQLGLGHCLVVGTGIGFNGDFGLRQNDRLARNIIEWTALIHRHYLPMTSRGGG